MLYVGLWVTKSNGSDASIIYEAEIVGEQAEERSRFSVISACGMSSSQKSSGKSGSVPHRVDIK